MKNFNTNQTRQLYVAGAIDANLDTNLDINLKQTETGELFFLHKGADGTISRSDTFDPKKIVSLKKTAAAKLAKPLMAHVVAVDTSAVTLADLVGKTIECIITIGQYLDYDPASTRTVVASFVGDSTNTASAAAFHKDLAMAIAKALPTVDPVIKVYSNNVLVEATTAAGSVTGNSNGVALVLCQGKFVLGKLSGDPCECSVAFKVADGTDAVWGTDTLKTVADLNEGTTYGSADIAPATISGDYELAELDYFAHGERGDYYRGATWPNDYPFTPAITIGTGYDTVSIEYYWAGDAENVQKSPRMIQIAASSAICTRIYNFVDAAREGAASSL